MTLSAHEKITLLHSCTARSFLGCCRVESTGGPLKPVANLSEILLHLNVGQTQNGAKIRQS